jgi:hypothetical protein
VLCDARDREPVKSVLITLLEHVMRGLEAEVSADRQPVQPCGPPVAVNGSG